MLHGPGNSQPHKATPCSGGHEVDVHALKGRRLGSCGDTPHPTPTPNPTPDPGPNPNPVPPTPTVVPAPKGHRVKTHPVDPAGKPASRGHTAAGAAAGALAATRRAELPFTGLRLWIVAALGLMLIGAGMALRQIRTV